MEQCVEANETAQALRQDGKVRAARVQLLICLAKSCPGPVRDDCAERMKEVERAAPTIVFVAKGPAGNSLRGVQITMDGARLADHLDGSALVVDPGEHVFALVADGYPSVSKKLVIREGVKGRKEVVMFTTATAPPDGEPVPVAPPSVVVQPEPLKPAATGSRQRTGAYALGGVGVVGLATATYVGLHAKSKYEDARCRNDTPVATCEAANDQATVSKVTFVVAGLFIGAGVAVFVTAPSDKAVSVGPSLTPTSASIQLGGSWQ
jgi:hypothetical protein